MKVRERIKIVVNDAPPEPCLDALKKAGFSFRFELGYVLLDDTFERGRIDRVRETLLKKGLEFEIFHSVFCEYSKIDFERADLLFLTFPEIEIPGLTTHTQCASCRRTLIANHVDSIDSEIETTHAIFSINGDIDVVNSNVRKAIEASGLRGIDCSQPVDTIGQYYRLRATQSPARRVILAEDVINPLPECSECGRPMYEILFGPSRFHRSDCNGMDMIEDSLLQIPFYSRKALQFFKKFERGIKEHEPAYLQ